MSEQEFEVFESLARPLVEWLNKNANPHAKIIIDSMSAEVVHGQYGFHTDEFLKD